MHFPSLAEAVEVTLHSKEEGHAVSVQGAQVIPVAQLPSVTAAVDSAVHLTAPVRDQKLSLEL